MLLLRLCMIPCLSYLARVVPPGTLAPHAKEFDSTVIRTASEKLGLPPSLDNVALLPLSLPIRLGGFGFRSVRLASPAAYWASFTRSVPYILEFVPESDRLIRGELKANFIEDVNSCHQALCTMIQNAPKELYPPDPNTIWTTYGQGAASRRLQKALCALIDDRVAAHYSTTRSSRADKQRMTSCSRRRTQANGLWHSRKPL